MSGIVIITTVGDEEQAISIAREIVCRRQAACVNIVPGVRSVYRWRGKICRDGEYMLVVKTVAEEYDAVAETIGELHAYELPEILCFEVSQGSPDFLQWLADSVDKTADDFSDEVDAPLDIDDAAL